MWDPGSISGAIMASVHVERYWSLGLGLCRLGCVTECASDLVASTWTSLVPVRVKGGVDTEYGGMWISGGFCTGKG